MHRFTSQQFITNQEERQNLRQYVRPGLNLHDLEEIKLIFDAFDTNQTGLVNPKDVKTAIEEEGEDARASALYQAVCDIAREGEGWIDFQKFVFFLSPNVTGQQSRQEIKRIYDLFDDQRNGKITLAGLRRAAAACHLEWQEVDLQEMIKQADTDKGGYIDFEEFYNIITYRPHLD